MRKDHSQGFQAGRWTAARVHHCRVRAVRSNEEEVRRNGCTVSPTKPPDVGGKGAWSWAQIIMRLLSTQTLSPLLNVLFTNTSYISSSKMEHEKIPGLMGDIEGGGKQQIMSTTCVLTGGREPEWSNSLVC